MIIHLSTLITIVIDFVAWLVIHLTVAYLVSRKPRESFNPDAWLYRQRKWERDGSLYPEKFLIRKWKEKLPDGAAMFKGGFAKKRLAEINPGYLEDFIRETCRAELTHWIAFLFGFIFFIWNIWPVGIVMVIYAIAANFPCILTQRYNRIRFKRLRSRISNGPASIKNPVY